MYNWYAKAFDENVHEVLVMTLRGMLKYLVLIIVHHLILIIARVIFIVLREGDTFGSVGTSEKRFSTNSKAIGKILVELTLQW